jgi:hypothetical protein
LKNMKPISDTSDEELNAKLETHVRNDRLFSWLVVLALISEAILTWAFRRENLEAVSLILANLAIAVGVFGEIHSGRREKMISGELDRRSKLRIAEANENARRLELEIAEQREKAALAERALLDLQHKITDRHVGDELYGAIFHAIPHDSKYSVTIFCGDPDSEPYRFAVEFSTALRFFGVAVTLDTSGVVLEPPGTWFILVRARDTRTLLIWFEIFMAAGFLGGAGREVPELAPDEIQLIIGEKRSFDSFRAKP